MRIGVQIRLAVFMSEKYRQLFAMVAEMQRHVDEEVAAIADVTALIRQRIERDGLLVECSQNVCQSDLCN